MRASGCQRSRRSGMSVQRLWQRRQKMTSPKRCSLRLQDTQASGRIPGAAGYVDFHMMPSHNDVVCNSHRSRSAHPPHTMWCGASARAASDSYTSAPKPYTAEQQPSRQMCALLSDLGPRCVGVSRSCHAGNTTLLGNRQHMPALQVAIKFEKRTATDQQAAHEWTMYKCGLSDRAATCLCMVSW